MTKKEAADMICVLQFALDCLDHLSGDHECAGAEAIHETMEKLAVIANGETGDAGDCARFYYE